MADRPRGSSPRAGSIPKLSVATGSTRKLLIFSPSLDRRAMTARSPPSVLQSMAGPAVDTSPLAYGVLGLDPIPSRTRRRSERMWVGLHVGDPSAEARPVSAIVFSITHEPVPPLRLCPPRPVGGETQATRCGTPAIDAVRATRTLTSNRASAPPRLPPHTHDQPG